MSYTNGTTHYNLPQTTGSDKRDWSDTNQAFADVDAALYGAVQDMAQAELDIDALETRMDTAEQNIATNTGDISGLDTRVTTVEGAVTSLSGQVTDVRQDTEDMICAFNEASATSTHAYGTGENDNHYFIYNDVLYRATQSIAIGDTIVPDTNCTTTNVTTEIQNITPHTTLIATATADGVKTRSALLDEFIPHFDTIVSNFPQKEYIIMQASATQSFCYRLSRIVPNDTITFTSDVTRPDPSVGKADSNGLNLIKAGSSTTIEFSSKGAYGSSSAVTADITNTSSSVPPAGFTFKLYVK